MTVNSLQSKTSETLNQHQTPPTHNSTSPQNPLRGRDIKLVKPGDPIHISPELPFDDPNEPSSTPLRSRDITEDGLLSELRAQNDKKMSELSLTPNPPEHYFTPPQNSLGETDIKKHHPDMLSQTKARKSLIQLKLPENSTTSS